MTLYLLELSDTTRLGPHAITHASVMAKELQVLGTHMPIWTMAVLQGRNVNDCCQ